MEKLGKKLKAHQGGKQHDDQIEEVVARTGGEGAVQDFVEQNKNLLLILGGALLLIVLGFFGYRFYQNGQNQTASNELYDAIQSFEAANYGAALNGDSTLNNMGVADVADVYGGTDAGNMAKYYAGVAYIKQGDVARGIDYLEDVSGSGNMLGVAANVALGFAHEEAGNFAEAAKSFEDAANTVGGNEFTTPFALKKAGENYEATGNSGKALNLYKKIKEKYPNSEEGRDIEKFIGRASS